MPPKAPFLTSSEASHSMWESFFRYHSLAVRPTRRGNSAESFPWTTCFCTWYGQTPFPRQERAVVRPTVSSTRASPVSAHKNLHPLSPKLHQFVQESGCRNQAWYWLFSARSSWKIILFSWTGRVPLLIYFTLLNSHWLLWIWFHRYLIMLLKTLALTAENLCMR